MCHMDPNLMRAARFQPTFDQSSVAKHLDRAIVRDGMFASTFGLDRHLLAVIVGTANPFGYGSCRRYQSTRHYGGVEPLDAVILELPGEALMRLVGLGGDQKAGGVFVDAMDYSGAGDAADAGKLPGAVVQQRVDQRAVSIARSGMDDHARRLVDHDEVGVFVDDVQRNILRDCLSFCGGWNVQGEGLTRRDF